MSKSWQWLAVALMAQAGWGTYPVLLRYLQTVSRVPSLSLLAMGNLVVLVVVVGATWQQLDWRVFRLPILWLFGLMVILRGVTNLLATRYTLAIYAQLIYLMTPFLVALLSRVVLKELLPPYTVTALSICLVGALLLMGGNLMAASDSTAVDRNDALGLTLAVFSSFSLALYMIVTRRTAHYQASGQSLLLVHLISLFFFATLASLLIGEDWSRWGQLQGRDWLAFAGLSGGILLLANLGQIRSIQHLGASRVSTMMAIRLVSAFIVAGLLLNERLTSLWQWAGTAIVICTITWYLHRTT